MSTSKIWIAPYLRVLIADTDPVYGAGLRKHLRQIGFRAIDHATTPHDTLDRMADGAYDIVMVEIAQPYRRVWHALEDAGAGTSLVVGMSLDRSGHDWVDAIHQGANAILMKAFYSHLLEPVLSHMLASRAAHRCRLVQFPQHEPMAALKIRPSRRFEINDSREWW